MAWDASGILVTYQFQKDWTDEGTKALEVVQLKYETNLLEVSADEWKNLFKMWTKNPVGLRFPMFVWKMLFRGGNIET